MVAILADDIFKCIFLKENYKISIHISLKICSQESNWKLASIGLGNGLLPNSRQVITYTTADSAHWRIYAALGDEITFGETSASFGQLR